MLRRGVQLFAARRTVASLMRMVTVAERRAFAPRAQTPAAALNQSRFAATAPPPPGAGAASKLPVGCVNITPLNYELEVGKAKVPVLLYFHVQSHAEVSEYTKLWLNQIEKTNNRLQEERDHRLGVARETQPEAFIKLAMVDCEREPAMAQQFQIARQGFPLIIFVHNGQAVDKIVGVLPEAQIVECIDALLNFARENTVEQPPVSKSIGKNERYSPDGKVQRFDENDENVMTLLQVATKKVRDKEFAKAKELFQRVVVMSEEYIEKYKKDLGVGLKKLTPEIMEKLRKSPYYNAIPQGLCGLAMTTLASKEFEQAFAIVKDIRERYPWAIRDLREVADTVARVELMEITGIDINKEHYLSLLKRDELVEDSLKFYDMRVKLAVAHFLERQYQPAIDELLKLIRAEPKLLKDAPKSTDTNPLTKTLARRCIFLMFEGLGNQNDIVVNGRKKLQAFLYV